MGDVLRFPARPLRWREAVGHELRRERIAQRRTQGDVATAAGISTQYLSEVERGRKEPSSEILEAASGALQVGLGELVRRAAELLEPQVLTTPAVTSTLTGAGPVDVQRRSTPPVLLAA